MNIDSLKNFVREKCIEYPHLENEFYDYYSLCLSEIEEGGSLQHEVELCINSIEELIKEN
jgi:hypothetical protein